MSNATHSILITAASGNIGEKLIPLLLATPSTKSHKLVLPTRDAARLRSKLGLPADADSMPNVVVAEGDVANAPWLEALMREHQVDTVFSNFSGMEELMLTFNLWSLCEETGVKHVVYVSASFDTTLDGVKNGAMRNLTATHCAYKFPAEQKLIHGSPKFTWTTLGPSYFFQNDYRTKAQLLENSYFEFPLGRGASRVDVADIALGGLRAIEDQGKKWGGKKIMIGSQKLYSLDETTKLWGDALGKSVTGMSTDWKDLHKLEAQIVQSGSGGAWARDLVLMCKQFDIDGFGMTDEQYREQVEFLGKEAASYEEFVKEEVRKWKAEQK